MSSRRKSGIGGFQHKKKVHKSKIKGCEMDTVSCTEMKEEPVAQDQFYQKEGETVFSKAENSKVGKSHEANLSEKNVCEKVSSSNIQTLENNIGEILNFGRIGTKDGDINDCRETTSDVSYKANIENASSVKYKANQQKQNTAHTTKKHTSGSLLKRASKISKSEMQIFASKTSQAVSDNLECERSIVTNEERANVLDNFSTKIKCKRLFDHSTCSKEENPKQPSKKEARNYEVNSYIKLVEKSKENDRQSKDTFCKDNLKNITKVSLKEAVRKISKFKRDTERKNTEFGTNIMDTGVIKNRKEDVGILQNVETSPLHEVRRSERIAKLTKIYYKETPLISKLRA